MFLVTTTTNTQTICSIESWLDACGTTNYAATRSVLRPSECTKIVGGTHIRRSQLDRLVLQFYIKIRKKMSQVVYRLLPGQA